jgi:hypothetical protein
MTATAAATKPDIEQYEELNVDYEYHSRQSQALDILGIEIPDLELLYGGAKGGGKSVLGCRWMFIEACEIIDKFGLNPSKYPLAIGFMGRKRGVDFQKTTLETWKKEVPAAAYRINEQKHEIIIFETVKIVFGGFDDRAVIEKFNSAEYCRAFVDQVEELTQHEIGMLRGTMRLKINGRVPLYKKLWTANPAQCWLKKEFVKNPDGKKEGLFFLPALPADNPYLPKFYTKTLIKAFRHRPELLEAYLHGSWDALEGADIIIKDVWVRDSHARTIQIAGRRKLIVADIARFGDDRTVIMSLLETEIDKVIIYGKKDTHYTSGKIAQAAKDAQGEDDDEPPLIVLDADGLGGPVADNLRAWGFKVHEIKSAGASSKPEKFHNLRAEMWWTAGEKFSDGDIANKYDGNGAEELDAELTIPTYKFRNGKILVEAKEDIKKPERYGKSPDVGDTYIYGLHGLQFKRPDRWDRERTETTHMAG